MSRTPKFVKQYVQIDQPLEKALRGYVEDVRSRVFPEDAHSFRIDQQVLEGLYGGK